MRRPLAAFAVAVLGACAGAPASHTRQQPVSTAHPEADPACHGVLSQCLAVTGLEQVVVKVGVSAEGKLAFVDVLTPELTRADAVELRRALEGCAWKPAIDANGDRVAGTLTLAIQR